MTRFRCLAALVLAMAGLATLSPAAGAAKRLGHPAVAVSDAPTQVVAEMSDHQAAAHVRPGPESRPDNAADNRRVPSKAQLNYFRAHDTSMPSRYLERVDGNYRGTTDEIVQWAAYKWGLDPDLLRAVAAVESWWHMSTVGDEGNAFGLFQIDARYHCCRRLAEDDTAFNADYYGAILRSYYDGTQTWLNTVSGNGEPYAPGDLWNSVGYWAAGRWDTETGWGYVGKVQADLEGQVWLQPYFTGE